MATEKGLSLDDAVGGLHDVKRVLRQAIEWPLMYADKLKALGVRKPPKMQESRLLLARIIFEEVPEGALTTPKVSEEEALRKTLVILQQAQLKEQADVIEGLKSAKTALITRDRHFGIEV